MTLNSLPNVVMLTVAINIIVLRVVMLSVLVPNVVAPRESLDLASTLCWLVMPSSIMFTDNVFRISTAADQPYPSIIL